MALLFCDGFDTPLSDNNQGIWTTNNFQSTPTNQWWEYSTNYARTGSYSLMYRNNTAILGTFEPYFRIGLGALYSEMYVGFGWLYDNDNIAISSSGNVWPLNISISDNGYPHTGLFFNTVSSNLELRTGTGAGTTGWNLWPNVANGVRAINEKTWNFIDVHILLGASGVGRFRTWVNGASDMDVTSSDIKNSNVSANLNILNLQLAASTTLNCLTELNGEVGNGCEALKAKEAVS